MPITPLSELIPPAIESKDHDICIDPEVDAGSNLKKRKVTDQALTYSNTDALGVSGIDGGALGVSGIKVGDTLLAKGHAPNGKTAWFQAVVLGLKHAQSSPYPPIPSHTIPYRPIPSHPIPSHPIPPHPSPPHPIPPQAHHPRRSVWRRRGSSSA